MTQVGVLEAKNSLSKLIRMLERGEEEQVVITRNNRPVARLTLLDKAPAKRIGVAKGQRLYCDGWDSPEINEEVAKLFGVGQ